MMLRRGLLASLAIFLITSAGIGFWFMSEMRKPYWGRAEGEVFVEIPRGATSSSIARQLADAGVLHSRLPFVAYLRWSDLARRLQAGEYRFAAAATPIEIARRIAAGDVYYLTLVIPEGLTARETAALIAKSGIGKMDSLLAGLGRADWIRNLAPGAKNLEGFLFPATYRVTRNTTSDEILQMMVSEFRARYAALSAQSPVPAGWNAERVVTLASIVEKEVKTPEERPLVASVMINRLKANMPLGCDATVIYALKIGEGFDGNLHRSDLAMESPYNTYTHRGLPPGPIASPGEASLRAALKPSVSDYLYYVSRNDGTHQFSTDYRSHELAVAKYQKSPARLRRPR
jgi:UPF0755 protein